MRIEAIHPGEFYMVRVAHKKPHNPKKVWEQFFVAKVVQHWGEHAVEVRIGKNLQQRAVFRPQQFVSLAESPESRPAPTTITLSIDTPGFRLASARVFQVWHALVSHAQEFGRGIITGHGGNAEPDDHAQEFGHGVVVGGDGKNVPVRVGYDSVYGEWTVDLLARACGVTRNTASTALWELGILGWVRTDRLRGTDGVYTGFRYWLLPPPAELTAEARRYYTGRAADGLRKVREYRKTIRETK